MNEVFAFILGRYDQQVGLLRDLALDSDSQRRFGPSTAGERAVLDEAEGMRDMRPPGPDLRPQQAGNLTREPVVGVKKVIVEMLTLGKGPDSRGKPGNLVVELVFIQTSAGR